MGSPVALYLASAGVGTIGIADADEVDLSNLQRQIIHTMKDLGKSKAVSAKETINSMNPDIKVNVYKMRISAYLFSSLKVLKNLIKYGSLKHHTVKV